MATTTISKKSMSTTQGTKSTTAKKDDKQSAIDLALQQIEQKFGQGSIMQLGKQATTQIPKTSSGSLSLDLALGGGFPDGRIIEIYGPESSGKTTLSLHAIAEVQKAGGKAAFIDAEHALDPTYAAKIGVDVEDLYLSQPSNGEEGMKIGVMFGNPETTSGGNALKFYCSVRLDVRRIDKILEKGAREGEEIVGNRVRVKVVKNKVAPPFRKAEFDIFYAQGISKEGDLIDLGVQFGVLGKAGAYYRLNDENIGQGKEQVRTFLKENPKIAASIEKDIRKIALGE